MAIQPLDVFYLTVSEADISTAGSVYIVAPSDGKLLEAYSVIDGAIATAPAVVTVKINGTAVTGGTITITHTSSAAGDVDSCVASGANHFVKGDYIEFATSGASTNTVIANYTAICKLSTN